MNKNITERNHVTVSGNGETAMVFAHGFGCDQNMWRYVVPAFKKNYTTVLFDYVGSGNSHKPSYNTERYATLHGYAQDVIDVIDSLGLKEVVFVGHSVSSMVGMLSAIERPELFSKMIMIGPSPCYINKDGYFGGFEHADIEGLLETMEKNYMGWANFLAPQIIANPDRPELGEELTSSFCSTDPVIAQQFAHATFFSDNRADLAKLKIPVLVLQCSEDIIASEKVGEYVHEHLPDSVMKVMKAKGHCPHLSEPEETVALMEEFLAR